MRAACAILLTAALMFASPACAADAAFTQFIASLWGDAGASTELSFARAKEDICWSITA